MDEKWAPILEEIARVGYETMFEEKWNDLPKKSIERAMWLEVATEMISKLWEIKRREMKDEN